MDSVGLLSSGSSCWNTYWRKSAKNLRVATPASGRPSRRLTIPDRRARPSRPALSSWRLIIERGSNPSHYQCRSRRVAWYAPERVEPVIAQQPAIITVPTILGEEFGQLLTDIQLGKGFRNNIAMQTIAKYVYEVAERQLWSLSTLQQLNTWREKVKVNLDSLAINIEECAIPAIYERLTSNG